MQLEELPPNIDEATPPNFNSILVQLEDGNRGYAYSVADGHFNSILVQLEGNALRHKRDKRSNFNSILVQLEARTFCASSD